MNIDHGKCPTCDHALPDDGECRICEKRLLITRRAAYYNSRLPQQTQGGEMRRKLFKAGLIVAGICPVVFFVLAGLSSLLPGCTPGGSGGPAFGCYFLGMNLNWLINFVTPAFIFSFFTVPAGLLLCLGSSFLPDKSQDKRSGR